MKTLAYLFLFTCLFSCAPDESQIKKIRAEQAYTICIESSAMFGSRSYTCASYKNLGRTWMLYDSKNTLITTIIVSDYDRVVASRNR